MYSLYSTCSNLFISRFEYINWLPSGCRQYGITFFKSLSKTYNLHVYSYMMTFFVFIIVFFLIGLLSIFYWIKRVPIDRIQSYCRIPKEMAKGRKFWKLSSYSELISRLLYLFQYKLETVSPTISNDVQNATLQLIIIFYTHFIYRLLHY